MSSPPPEVSGRKFLLYFLFPAIIIFGIVLKVLGPDKPLGGPSSFYPQRSAPSPTPTPAAPAGSATTPATVPPPAKPNP